MQPTTTPPSQLWPVTPDKAAAVLLLALLLPLPAQACMPVGFGGIGERMDVRTSAAGVAAYWYCPAVYRANTVRWDRLTYVATWAGWSASTAALSREWAAEMGRPPAARNMDAALNRMVLAAMARPTYRVHWSRDPELAPVVALLAGLPMSYEVPR